MCKDFQVWYFTLGNQDKYIHTTPKIMRACTKKEQVKRGREIHIRICVLKIASSEYVTRYQIPIVVLCVRI